MMKAVVSISVLLVGIGVWGCGSSDGGDDVSAGDTGGTSSSSNDTGGTSSSSNDTGGSSSGSDTGGSSNTGTYDTVTSEGEFSFFVISWDFLQSKAENLSCDSAGTQCSGALGGKLGGLEGADDLCTQAAQAAYADDQHQWRAYLSTSTVDAKSRIGNGPWYSAPPAYQNRSDYASEGLLFGDSTTIFNDNRPGDSTTIVWVGTSASGGGGGGLGPGSSGGSQYPFNQCYLDEWGICVQDYGDSHDTMTGTETDGTKSANNCDDWTTDSSSVQADLGHSWPRQLNSVDADMNWSRSNETHPCAGKVNLTSTMGNQLASTYQNGVGSEGGYGAFYCFAYITGSA